MEETNSNFVQLREQNCVISLDKVQDGTRIVQGEKYWEGKRGERERERKEYGERDLRGVGKVVSFSRTQNVFSSLQLSVLLGQKYPPSLQFIRKKRNPTRKNKVASSLIGLIRTRLLLPTIEAETCAIFCLKEDRFNLE